MTGSPATSQPLTAVLSETHRRSRPVRLVLVADHKHGNVPTWWHLDRGKRWRCGVHGTMHRPECDHVQAAAALLARELLGLEGRS